MNDCIVTFKTTADLRLLDVYKADNVYVPKNIPNIALCRLSNGNAELLKEETEVISVEVDEVENTDSFDASSTQTESYAIELMDVKSFHSQGIKGKGVKVAVFDTGVQLHEDLDIKGGINAYDKSKPYDANISNRHGTMVAGVLAAKDNEKGTLGVAPECDLYAVRFDDGSGSSAGARWSEQIIAMDWAIDNDIDAINCSFSGTNDSTARKQAFKKAYDAGIAIFCSANNRQGDYALDVDRMFYPSRYPFVVTSANINKDKSRYTSSSVGRNMNFSSGGVLIKSTTIDTSKSTSDKYATGTGTSYASPAVARMYALYKQMYQHESRDKLLQRMYVNAENIGNIRYFGAGIPKYPVNNYENIIMNESLE